MQILGVSVATCAVNYRNKIVKSNDDQVLSEVKQ